MDRFWLKYYPPGVPSDIDPSVYPSLVDLLEEAVARMGGTSSEQLARSAALIAVSPTSTRLPAPPGSRAGRGTR